MALSKEKTRLVERLRNPRLRPREGFFLVEGIRGIREVLRAPGPPEVRFALAAPRLLETEAGGELRSRLSQGRFPVVEVSDEEMEALSDTGRSQGALLVVAEPRGSLDALPAVPRPRLLLLDGLQDPGNVGTLVRAAWAFGVDGVLALDGTVDPWNAKVVRASAGALLHLPVVRAPWAEAAAWLAVRKVPLLVADARGEDIRGFRPECPWALVVGNEGAGPRRALLSAGARTLAIPMVPGADSLNAGVAGAILLFSLTLRTEGKVED